MGSSINLADFGTKLTNEDARFEKESVADLLNRRNMGFPGAQPVSFARKHIDELQRRDYFMCEKTDGIRCLLYLNQFNENGDFVESQLLIDRKNDYYYIPRDTVHIPCAPASDKGAQEGFEISGFHTRTLIDGELVLQRKEGGGTRLAYLMFDILALDGENIMGRPFDKRMARLESRIWKPYKKFAEKWQSDVDAQPFELKLKQMELPYGVMMMFKDKIPNLPHGNDGLIFTCVGTHYVSGTDEHILKWKPPQENTIDFKLQIAGFPTLEDEDGVYEDWDACPYIELLVNHGQEGYQKFAELTLSDTEWSAMKSMNQAIDHRIIECWREAQSGIWRPKIEDDGTPRFRDDKTEANHISTVTSVLESIEDAVSEQDLIDNAQKIRTGWKERQRAKEEEERRAAAEEKRRRDAAAARAKEQEQQQQQQRVAAAEPMNAEDEESDGPTYED